MFRVNNKNKRNDVSDVVLVFIVDSEHFAHLFLVLLLLTLNK